MSAHPESHPTRRSFLAASGLGAASLLLPSRWAPADAAGDPWAQADAIAAGIAVPTFPDRDFDITRHGAAPDSADSTAAIARAVAACSAAGGGRVLVPAGTFHTGPVHLRSGVNLHVAKGAVLRFSTDPGDYLPVVPTSYEGNDCYNYSPLVYAYRQTNIAVTGEGTLDGQASRRHWWPWVPKAVWGWRKGMPHQGADSRKLRAQGQAGVPVGQRVYGAGHHLRPTFIEPYGCTNVLIEGVRLVNPPFWQIHPLFSRHVTVRGVTVTSQGPNDDGCDPECSSDVLIDGCHFDTRDDCIAIKSGRGRDGLRRGTPSRNIVIRGCRMSRGGHAVAIGSEEAAGVSDVYVDGLTGDDARLFGGVLVKAQSFYGAGTVERVHVRNVRLAGVQNAAIAMTYYYGGTPEKGPYRPTFRDLSFSGFTCGRSRNALNLDGFPDHPIGPVQVSDSAFGGVSGQGVAARNVTGLRLTNVRINGKPVGG